MRLTAKQENFAQHVSRGKTLSDAYREIYKPKGSTEKTIWEAASKLAANSKVRPRIEELQKENQQHLKYDTEAHFKELNDIKNLAINNEKTIGVAAKVIELKGKVCGLYTEKKEMSGSVEFVLKFNDDNKPSTPR